MVAAGHVVAEGGGAERADEQAAGAPDLASEALGVRADQLEVLGGVGLDDRDARALIVREREPDRRRPRQSDSDVSSVMRAWTASSSSALGEASSTVERPPCSPCASRSSATVSAEASAPARIARSLGP